MSDDDPTVLMASVGMTRRDRRLASTRTRRRRGGTLGWIVYSLVFAGTIVVAALLAVEGVS
jgi:hypothetical protein